jgi:hypothetical protein
MGKAIGTAFTDPIDSSKSMSIIIPAIAGSWASTNWPKFTAFGAGPTGLGTDPGTYGETGWLDGVMGYSMSVGNNAVAKGTIPIILPVGCVITAVDVCYKLNKTNILYSVFGSQDMTSNTGATIATDNASVAGPSYPVRNLYAGAGITVAADTAYGVLVVIYEDTQYYNGGTLCKGLRVTYTSPNLHTRI